MDKCDNYGHSIGGWQLQGQYMGNDNTNTNVIPLHKNDETKSGLDKDDCHIEDVSDFIVDMLDTLMRIATKKDHSLLVYFLAMARIEATELNRPRGGAPEKG